MQQTVVVSSVMRKRGSEPGVERPGRTQTRHKKTEKKKTEHPPRSRRQRTRRSPCGALFQVTTSTTTDGFFRGDEEDDGFVWKHYRDFFFSFLFFFHVQKLGKFNQNSLAELVEITLEKQNFPKKIQIALSKNGEVSPEKIQWEA